MFLESLRGSPFRIINDNPGLMMDDADYPAMSFQLRDGRIQSAPSDFPQYVGMRSDAFLQQLRSISRTK